jgi:mRNA-degrading endonuclease YafQ of YafQ-DinJ toxin-antitoxin module
MEVVNLFATGMPLPHRHFDHPRSGEWSDHRDCQIRTHFFRRAKIVRLLLIMLHNALGLETP